MATVWDRLEVRYIGQKRTSQPVSSCTLVLWSSISSRVLIITYRPEVTKDNRMGLWQNSCQAIRRNPEDYGSIRCHEHFWIRAHNPKYLSATALRSTITRYTWNVLSYTSNMISQQKEINIINLLHYVTVLHLDPEEWQVLCVIALWKTFTCLKHLLCWIHKSFIWSCLAEMRSPDMQGQHCKTTHSFSFFPAHVPLNSVKLFFPTDTQLWNSSWFSLAAHRKSEVKGFSSTVVAGLGQYASQQQTAKSTQAALTLLLSLFSLPPVSFYHFLSLPPLTQSYAHPSIFFMLPHSSSFPLLKHSHNSFSIFLPTCPTLLVSHSFTLHFHSLSSPTLPFACSPSLSPFPLSYFPLIPSFSLFSSPSVPGAWTESRLEP